MTERAAAPTDDVDIGFAVTDQQRAFFDAFGFINLRGLFAPEIDQISAAFDDLFVARRAQLVADEQAHDALPEGSARDRISQSFGIAPVIDTYEHLNFGGHRAIIAEFLESTAQLAWRKDDPRIRGAAAGLIGPDWEYFGSDGNIFDCDTSWHMDAYGAPIEQYHVKFLFYIDPLDRSNGALRVLPGTSFHEDDFAKQVRPGLFHRERTEETFGITVEEVPAHVVDNQPGDLIAINFRTAHATFNSQSGRRLFTLNYRERSTSPAG
jgi:hypothetical protein